MKEAPENVAGRLISPKEPVQRIPGQFINIARILTPIDIIKIFAFHTNINSGMCIEQPHVFMGKLCFSKQFLKTRDSSVIESFKKTIARN